MIRCYLVAMLIALPFFNLAAQSESHPHLYFDSAGMEALRSRIQNHPLLNKMWLKFKRDRVDRAMNLTVPEGPFDSVNDREYGDALADLTIAYIATRDGRYVAKAKEIIFDIIQKPSWGEQLVIAHISIGLAFCYDVMYDQFSSSERNAIRENARARASNHVNPNQLSNHNWTPSAGEGLIGLAFGFNDLVNEARQNFKEGDRSVLWAHSEDGFSPQGLGYWRKYNHVALFFHALRFNTGVDWFHLGKEFPGSAFLGNSAYPRIYGDVQHRDFSCLTWNDSKQVGIEPQGPYGCMGMLALAASEYNDGIALDFFSALINENRYRFENEDSAAFILFDDSGVAQRSYRDLPLSGYWPNMEGAVFRSGWDKDALVFYMRCGSPGGHARRIKGLPPDQHSHPDANGFVLFYKNDYLAAEDASSPQSGPDVDRVITYGHNTILIDGVGQKGDKSTRLSATDANMDFLDADHVGFLLGDATDAYPNLNRFYRYVIYKKHKYVIIVDELKDDVNHKYEFLLGTDHRHIIGSASDNRFNIRPVTGSAKLPVVFVEPRNLSHSINKDRPYVFSKELVEMLRVWPGQNNRNATFFALLYPHASSESDPGYTKIYEDGRSGIVVDGDEHYLYNDSGALYTRGAIQTDSKLVYFKNSATALEYLAAGATRFLYNGQQGIVSSKRLVAAFDGVSGKIRLGKNLGESGEATITLFYPGITGVRVDGQPKSLVNSSFGYRSAARTGQVTFRLSPKQYHTGPTGYEQTVTDNYDIEILTSGTPPAFVQVIAPNGGESWTVGSSHSIQWNSDGSFANVKIEYSTNNGGSWQTVANNTANDGQFTWTAPDTPSASARVRISDAADGSPSDVSDNVFAIVESVPAPVVSSFIPSSGAVGTAVTIRGSHFSGATVVKFNTVAASFSILSDSQIAAAVPAGASTGKISVANVAGTGTSSQDFVVTSDGGGEIVLLPKDDTYVRSSQPGEKNGAVRSLRVRKTASADYYAYFKFVVTGVGDVTRARLRLYVNDASPDGGAIYLVSNHYDGSTTPWDEAGLNWNNAPKITGQLLSAVGPAALDTEVEFDVTAAISGDGEYSFAIKNNSADVLKYASKESNHPPRLSIVGGSGSNAPVITSFSPTSGPVGAMVTISGNGFFGATAASFNTVAANFNVVSNSQILAQVPDGAASGPIRVITPDGAAVSSVNFTVTSTPAPIPLVSNFTPASGAVGTVVTISGENFTEAMSVQFNSVEANFSTLSDSQIIAAVPLTAATGKIRVASAAGSGVSAQDFVVTGGGASQTLSFSPTDDAFVWSNNPSNNYGPTSNLRVRKTSELQIAFFKFNVAGLSGNVTRAILRLRCNDSSNDGGGVYVVSNNFLNSSTPWTENGLLWTNAPTVSGSPLISAGAVSAGQVVEFDVTSAIAGDGIYSFAIRNGSSDVVYYSSKEGNQIPQLEITTGSSSALAKSSDEIFDDLEIPNRAIPDRLTLLPNYPNPFNAETTIEYGLPEAAEVRLVIYNLRGQEVRTLVNEFQAAGFKNVRWDGLDEQNQSVSSGIYFIQLRAGNQQFMKKITLQK